MESGSPAKSILRRDAFVDGIGLRIRPKRLATVRAVANRFGRHKFAVPAGRTAAMLIP